MLRATLKAASRKAIEARSHGSHLSSRLLCTGSWQVEPPDFWLGADLRPSDYRWVVYTPGQVAVSTAHGRANKHA